VKLSILMPVYNEAPTVQSAIKRVLEVSVACPIELVVVDDASTDGTSEILDGLHDERLVKLRHPVNRGKGAAVRTAAAAATGDYVQPFDADLEYSPADIPAILEPVLRGEAEVVYGNRIFGSHSAYSFWYVMGNKFVTMIANILFNAYIADLETCFKLMPADLFHRLDITSNGFGMEAEITGKLLARGIRPYEVPISYRARSRAAGKKITWRDGLQAVRILARIRLGKGAQLLPDRNASQHGVPTTSQPGNTRRAAPADFGAADAELAEALDNLDAAGNYAAWILGLVEPHLGDEVLEVGAGHGTFTEMLARNVKRIVASDLSERCADKLDARFSDEPSVEVLHGGIDAAANHGPFDSAILINVLEHIEDDEGALRELAGLLKPGGRLLLWVPALSYLYSDFDRRIGHHRRYSRTGLRTRLGNAGYAVRDVRYVNAVGAVAWLLLARFLHRTPTEGVPVRIFDRWFVPVLKRVEHKWRPPFGQSIFAVAEWPRNPMASSSGVAPPETSPGSGQHRVWPQLKSAPNPTQTITTAKSVQ